MAVETTTMPDDVVVSYLRQPYGRLVIPEDDGTYRGEILEFPGCIATGNSASETLASLEEVARDWLEAALECGQNVPEPVETSGFSGRLVLRLPKSLHKKAARIAERDGISLNQFIMVGLAEYVGERANQPHTMNFVMVNINTSVISGFSQTRLQNYSEKNYIEYTTASLERSKTFAVPSSYGK
jgi:predicted HicB family RNase H-like nuclease